MSAEFEQTPLANGVRVIRSYLEHLPGSAGVYRMLDAKGDVLYVGKARNLKNRVSSYVNLAGAAYRTQQMVAHTASMEIVLTKNEAEALLLEATLIKKHQPKYNVLLRDDKSFPYIFLSHEHPYPRIMKYRGPQTQKGTYFGPFASAGAVNQTITFLQRAFLLRPCSDTVFKNRTRPCLQYQIKRCSAPCVKYISEEDYGALLRQSEDFLSGKNREIQDLLLKEMQVASEAMDYETAARLRDRIRALTQVQNQQSLAAVGLIDADVIALYREGSLVSIQVFFFRSGRNYGNKSFFPAHVADRTDQEVLSAFIAQFYQRQAPPKLVLTSIELEDNALLEEALAMSAGRKVEVCCPQRGERRQMMEQALANAKQSLQRQQSISMVQRDLLEKVAALFNLEGPPERIEVYDNSHIMGTHAVGAMIVAGPEGFTKKAYRQFNIKSKDITPGDDYGMLREVLTRRFSRLQQETTNRDTGAWPNLVLIDGGENQLKVMTQVLNDLGITDVCYASIAKGPDRNAGREWFYMPDKPPFQLAHNDPVLHYLQRLRDEAHRFAIGTHRARRSSAIPQSELDQIPGIGAGRKKALLHHFGSSKAVANASIEEIAQVAGINRKTAETIYTFFHH